MIKSSREAAEGINFEPYYRLIITWQGSVFSSIKLCSPLLRSSSSFNFFFLYSLFQVVLAEAKIKAVCWLYAEELPSRLQVSRLCATVHCRVLWCQRMDRHLCLIWSKVHCPDNETPWRYSKWSTCCQMQIFFACLMTSCFIAPKITEVNFSTH